MVAPGRPSGEVNDGSSGLTEMLVPDADRSRAAGIRRALSVVAIPLSTAIGGWLADRAGVVPVFAGAGPWILGVAALAWANAHVRSVGV